MENNNQSNSSRQKVNRNSSSLSLKPNINFLLTVLSIFLSAVIFGFIGYSLGKKSININIPVPTQSEQSTLKPSPTISAVPSSTPKATRKLTYSLPANWKTITDTNGRLEVGYDTNRYEPITKANQVELLGKWVGTQGSDLHRLGWHQYFYLTSYNGGSRHSELYKILGVTANTKDWKSPKSYSEREYSYFNWNCLVINGVDISQYPSAWAYCPISNNEALVLAFDGPDWPEIEQQMAAVRILK